MTKEVTTVSLRGNQTYVKALKALAYSRGMTIGDLVRDAIDKEHAHNLKPHLDFFCAQDESKNSQLSSINNGHCSTKS